MVVSVLDERGRRCSVRHDFTLFSLADRRPPIHTPEWFYQDGKEFEGDRPVHLYVGSSEKDVYLFYDVFCGDKRIESKRMILDNEIRRFTYSYKLEYGNGITVRFVFMREGKLYSKQVRITRPHSEKISATEVDCVPQQVATGQQRRMAAPDYASGQESG